MGGGRAPTRAEKLWHSFGQPITSACCLLLVSLLVYFRDGSCPKHTTYMGHDKCVVNDTVIPVVHTYMQLHSTYVITFSLGMLAASMYGYYMERKLHALTLFYASFNCA